MNSLTLHFTEGNFGMFPFSQDILYDLHNTEHQKSRVKDVCFSTRDFTVTLFFAIMVYLIVSFIIFQRFLYKKTKTTQV